MNAVMIPVTWTQAGLVDRGFAGFVPFSAIDWALVPKQGGIYVVLRPDDTGPEIVFVGRANGLGGLRRRLRRSARDVANYRPASRRSIWQPGIVETLIVGWAPTSGWEPELVQQQYLQAFRAAFGHLPYANR